MLVVQQDKVMYLKQEDSPVPRGGHQRRLLMAGQVYGLRAQTKYTGQKSKHGHLFEPLTMQVGQKHNTGQRCCRGASLEKEESRKRGPEDPPFSPFLHQTWDNLA